MGDPIRFAFTVTNKTGRACRLAAFDEGTVSLTAVTRDGVAVTPDFAVISDDRPYSDQLAKSSRSLASGQSLTFPVISEPAGGAPDAGDQSLRAVSVGTGDSSVAASWNVANPGRYSITAVYAMPPVTDSCPGASAAVTVGFTVTKRCDPAGAAFVGWGALALFGLVLARVRAPRRGLAVVAGVAVVLSTPCFASAKVVTDRKANGEDFYKTLNDCVGFLASHGEYSVVFPDQAVAEIAPISVWGLRIIVFPPQRMKGAGTLHGLLGTFSGDPATDLVTGTGAIVSAQPSREQLYGTFADSWRVTDATSLLPYPPGTNTATFTDKSFPDKVETVADLDPGPRDAARRLCASLGLTDRAAQDACVIDLLLTGQPAFALSASTTEQRIGTSARPATTPPPTGPVHPGGTLHDGDTAAGTITPHAGFSLASRSTRALMFRCVGGRPGRRRDRPGPAAPQQIPVPVQQRSRGDDQPDP